MRLVLSVYPFIDVESSREVKSVTQSHTASAGLSLDVILSGAYLNTTQYHHVGWARRRGHEMNVS